jgi:hypothetical protein
MSAAEPEITGIDSEEKIRLVMAEALSEIGMEKVVLNGEELSAHDAFVNHDGINSLAGYVNHMHNELYGFDTPEDLPFSVTVLLLTDALTHAQEHYLTPEGAINLDAMAGQYGNRAVPAITGAPH